MTDVGYVARRFPEEGNVLEYLVLDTNVTKRLLSVHTYVVLYSFFLVVGCAHCRLKEICSQAMDIPLS